MEKRAKKLLRVCANTKGAFTRLEKFVDNYSTDPKPEKLQVRLKLTNENREKYTEAQEELEELGHDTKSATA
jgi:flagellar basal body-associated protein FliL